MRKWDAILGNENILHQFFEYDNQKYFSFGWADSREFSSK